jgi:hypothetical protein
MSRPTAATVPTASRPDQGGPEHRELQRVGSGANPSSHQCSVEPAINVGAVEEPLYLRDQGHAASLGVTGLSAGSMLGVQWSPLIKRRASD